MLAGFTFEPNDATERLEEFRLEAQQDRQDSSTTAKTLCSEDRGAILSPSVPHAPSGTDEVNKLLAAMRQSEPTKLHRQSKLARINLPPRCWQVFGTDWNCISLCLSARLRASPER